MRMRLLDCEGCGGAKEKVEGSGEFDEDMEEKWDIQT